MRTKLSICAKKARFASAAEAIAAADRYAVRLLPYRCNRGAHFHLTSRTRGKRVERPSD